MHQTDKPNMWVYPCQSLSYLDSHASACGQRQQAGLSIASVPPKGKDFYIVENEGQAADAGPASVSYFYSVDATHALETTHCTPFR